MPKEPTLPFSQQTSAKARRAAERRAAQHRSAYEAAIRAGRDTSAPAPAAAGVKQPRPVRPARRLAFYSLTAAVAAMATLLVATPLLGTPWNFLYLGIGVIAVLLLLERAWHWSQRVSARPRVLLLGASGLLVTLFVVGSLNQVVIDGQPYLASSDTAKAYRLSEEVYADLLVLRDNDRYLSLPSEQARTHADDIATAAAASQEVADRWNPSIERDLPSPSFEAVLRDVNASADAQALALTALGEDLLQPDAGRQSQIATTRRNSVESFVTATNQLRQATNLYGFDPTYTEGPVE